MESADFTWLGEKSNQNEAGSFWLKIGPRLGQFKPIRADSRPESTTAKIGQFRTRQGKMGRGGRCGSRGRASKGVTAVGEGGWARVRVNKEEGKGEKEGNDVGGGARPQWRWTRGVGGARRGRGCGGRVRGAVRGTGGASRGVGANWAGPLAGSGGEGKK